VIGKLLIAFGLLVLVAYGFWAVLACLAVWFGWKALTS
jgi:hypothetical protein